MRSICNLDTKVSQTKNPCRGELIQSINCFSVSFRRSHNWVPIKKVPVKQIEKKNNSKRNKRNILAYLISAVLHSKTVDSNQLEKRNNQVGEFYQAKGGGGRERQYAHTAHEQKIIKKPSTARTHTSKNYTEKKNTG